METHAEFRSGDYEGNKMSSLRGWHVRMQCGQGTIGEFKIVVLFMLILQEKWVSCSNCYPFVCSVGMGLSSHYFS